MHLYQNIIMKDLVKIGASLLSFGNVQLGNVHGNYGKKKLQYVV